MAEFVLDHLTLQKLHVVDDEQVDIAQRILQSQRVIIADRGCETPHEIFGRQIDHARIARAVYSGIGDCLQKMRLAEADTRMDEQRIEAHGAGTGFGDRLCRRKRDAVGRAFDKGIEGETCVERRTEQRPGTALTQGRLRSRRLCGRRRGLRRNEGLVTLNRADFRNGLRPFLRLCRTDRAAGRADQNLHLQHIRILALDEVRDQIHVTVVDPGLQKGRRNGKTDDAFRNGMEFEPCKPACIDLRTNLCLEPRAKTFKQRIVRHCRFVPCRI